MNLLFCCSYDGSTFNGFSKQKIIHNTIQETIENIFKQVLDKKNFSIYGCGRTDKGVHAIKYFFHAYIENDFTIGKWKKVLNKMLPRTIYILYIRKVPLKFHCRYDAIDKIYLYKIRINSQTGLKNNYYWDVNVKNMVPKIITASKLFHGEHNFMSYFGKIRDSKTNNFVRTIFGIRIIKQRKIIKIYITGSGFGRYMVRFMVGAMVSYSLGKISLSFIRKTIKNPNKKFNIMKAPASGLYLYNVSYKF